jgi:hypothetical protein
MGFSWSLCNYSVMGGIMAAAIVLAAITLAVLLFRTANSAYGSIAGLVAFSAFGLNLLSPRLATLVRTDMPLAFVIFLIGLLIWQKLKGRKNGNRGIEYTSSHCSPSQC